MDENNIPMLNLHHSVLDESPISPCLMSKTVNNCK